MNRKLENLIFAICFVLAAMYATSLAMRGVGLLSGIQLIVIFSPFLMAAAIYFQRYWVGCAVALLTFGLSLPLPIINRFGLGVLFAGVVVCFVIAQSAIQKSSQLPNTLAPKLIYFASFIVFARIIYDRPGSARFGGSGGIGEASVYLLGFMAFWAFGRLCCRTYNARDLLKPLIAFTIISCVIQVLRSFPSGLSLFLYHLFNRPLWMAGAISLAVVFYWSDQRKHLAILPFLHLGVVGGILCASAVSAHRSRPLFAVAIILSIAWIYGRLKGSAIMIGLMGVLGIGGLLAFHPSGLPTQFTRSLSTVVSVDEESFRSIAAGNDALSREVGWSSGFRKVMYTLALKRISQQPLAGNGFNFSLQDMMDEYYLLSGEGGFKGIGTLALAGVYHNSLLALAVFCGLPAAILCGAGILMIFRQFLLYARDLPSSADKVVAACLVGYFSATTGQMLMNGASADLFRCLLMLGIMVGIMQKKELSLMAESTSSVRGIHIQSDENRKPKKACAVI